jgi:hypothetical protein
VLAGGGWSTPRPGRFTPAKKIPYPLYRRLSGPQDRSARVRKVSPPSGFDPLTVQLVASRCTGYAIPVGCNYRAKNSCFCQESNSGHPAHNQSVYWFKYSTSRRYENNIEMNFREVGCECVDIIGVGQGNV